MTKPQQIRDALAPGPLSFRDLHLKIGGDDAQLRKCLSNMQNNGHLNVARDEDKTVTLTVRRAPPRKGKKPAHKSLRRFQRRMNKGKRVKRPYKRLADGVSRSSLVTRHSSLNLGALALDNYLGAGALLRQAIKDQVEGLADNHALRNAVENHERAEEILNAARDV